MIIWLFFVLLFLAVPYAIAIPVIASLSPKRPSKFNTAIGGLICGIGLALLGMFAPFWIFDGRTNVHDGNFVLYFLFMPPAFGFFGIIIGALVGSRLPRNQ